MGVGDTERYPELSGQDHPTVPLPPVAEQSSDATPAPSTRTRRRWPWVLGVAIVLLAGAVVGAEFLARGLVTDTIRAEVLKAMSLPDDQQLEVDARGIMLPQLIGGSLDDVRLSSNSVSFAGLTGAVDIEVKGVPLRGGPLQSATGSVRLDESQFTTLVAKADLPMVEKIDVDAPNVTALGSFSLFGAQIPLSLTLVPGVIDGDLTVEPVSATVAGAEFDMRQLRDQFGSIADGLTETRRICIADQLPAGIRITDLDVQGDDIVAYLSADGEIASDPALRANGTCPAR